MSSAVTVAILMSSMTACESDSMQRTATPSDTSASHSFDPFPPPVNEATLVPGPVSQLHPGMSIMVGEAAPQVCRAGFYIDFPEHAHPGKSLSAFVTAGQCAAGDGHAPVSVMRADAGHQPQQTQIGEIIFLSPGDTEPAVEGQPWTIPIAPLAVFPSDRSQLPVDLVVNEQAQTDQTVEVAAAVEQRSAPVKWTDNFGRAAAGRVLNPASTPELANIPSAVSRVVVATAATDEPISQWVLGSPVTLEMNGTTYNLGIITGVDEERHWIVVDLIGPFLAQQGAHLTTSR